MFFCIFIFPMNRIIYLSPGILILSFLMLCCKANNRKDKVPENQSEKLASDSSALSRYNLEDESPQTVKLPGELNEISGITVTGDGRLFCEGDEDADIFELDYKSGAVVKKFYAGNSMLGSKQGDFEDIAFVKGKFYLLESKGRLLEFSEGIESEHVDYKIYETKLIESNDVEGLCYDPE